MSNKPEIKLEHGYHRDQKVVLIMFCYNTTLIEQVKRLPGRRCSQTNRCWYIPADNFHLDKFLNKISGIADIDASNIKDNGISNISTGSIKKSLAKIKSPLYRLIESKKLKNNDLKKHS